MNSTKEMVITSLFLAIVQHHTRRKYFKINRSQRTAMVALANVERNVVRFLGNWWKTYSIHGERRKIFDGNSNVYSCYNIDFVTEHVLLIELIRCLHFSNNPKFKEISTGYSSFIWNVFNGGAQNKDDQHKVETFANIVFAHLTKIFVASIFVDHFYTRNYSSKFCVKTTCDLLQAPTLTINQLVAVCLEQSYAKLFSESFDETALLSILNKCVNLESEINSSNTDVLFYFINEGLYKIKKITPQLIVDVLNKIRRINGKSATLRKNLIILYLDKNIIRNQLLKDIYFIVVNTQETSKRVIGGVLEYTHSALKSAHTKVYTECITEEDAKIFCKLTDILSNQGYSLSHTLKTTDTLLRNKYTIN